METIKIEKEDVRQSFVDILGLQILYVNVIGPSKVHKLRCYLSEKNADQDFQKSLIQFEINEENNSQ